MAPAASELFNPTFHKQYVEALKRAQKQLM